MNKILRVYLKLCLLLLPISFLPLFLDSFGMGKNWLMLLAMLLGLVFWAVKIVIKGEEKIKVSWGWWWLLALTLWATVFWYFGEAGIRMKTWMGVPGLGMMWSLVIWTFLWLQTSGERDDSEEKWLTITGLIVAVSSLAVFLIPTTKLPISWPKDNPMINIGQDWSLLGSILGEIWLLAILGAIWIKKLLGKIKARESYLVEMIITSILVLVVFLDIFKMVRSGWNYLDLNSSWVIATESLKNRPLQGVGIGNYTQAFYWWRPMSFNNHKNWTGTFNWGANSGLQLWTELGLVGLLIGVFAVMAFLKDQKNKSDKIMVFLLAILLALTPITMVSLWLAMWLVSKNVNSKEIRVVLRTGESGKNAGPGVLAILVVAGVIFTGFWWAKVFLGEYNIRKSMLSAAKNDGGSTYNWQIKAIAINPNNAEYRQIYSQTNMALAAAILAKTDLTDDDKEKASTLIQQAVRESKAAVSLDSKNPAYWNNLAMVYRQLVGTVEGSADWSYQAYAEAVRLDPMNPNLKLDFGGLLYAAGQYEEADRVFEQVVTLKPDLANGWYNWAYSAKNLKKLGEAIARLTQAVNLVPVDSGDYDKASQELATWKKEYEDLVKESQAVKEAETLKVPEALPTPNKEEQVNIPAQDLQPPKVEVTPTEGE